MELHTIRLHTLTRGDNFVQTELIPTTELNFNTTEPIEITKRIKQLDNLVDIPITSSDNQYLIIRAVYINDDASINVVKGDPAPFKIRINGDTIDKEIKGLLVWCGNITNLKVSTDYVNDIELKILIG